MLSRKNCNIVLHSESLGLKYKWERDLSLSWYIYISRWTHWLSRRCLKLEIWGSNPSLDTNFSLNIYHLFWRCWFFSILHKNMISFINLRNTVTPQNVVHSTLDIVNLCGLTYFVHYIRGSLNSNCLSYNLKWQEWMELQTRKWNTI